jgi:hypothetical protein
MNTERRSINLIFTNWENLLGIMSIVESQTRVQVTHMIETFSSHIVSPPSSQTRMSSDSHAEDIFEPHCQSSKLPDENVK